MCVYEGGEREIAEYLYLELGGVRGRRKWGSKQISIR